MALGIILQQKEKEENGICYRREKVETGVNHPGGQRPDTHWYDAGKVLNRRLAKFGDSDVQGSLGKR